jgi:hypothetical protein
LSSYFTAEMLCKYKRDISFKKTFMQEKSLIKKNILQYLDLKGITKYKFYQNTGITRGVLDQNNGMSEENTTKFLAYYKDVSAEWLIMGTGSMLKDQTISEIKSTKATPDPTPAPAPASNIDLGTMELILNRYDGLVAENALLKQEVSDLRTSRGNNTNTSSYTVDSRKVSPPLAAEPSDHTRKD